MLIVSDAFYERKASTWHDAATAMFHNRDGDITSRFPDMLRLFVAFPSLNSSEGISNLFPTSSFAINYILQRFLFYRVFLVVLVWFY